jgi:uncharacterized protein (TIGR03435 family)
MTAALLACAILAQSPPAPSAALDVASVKENTSASQEGFVRLQPGRVTITNLSLRSLLRYAFTLREQQLIGAPGWTSQTYDIAATYHGDADTQTVRAMLQRLLADRFGLRAHHEQRELPTYALGVERAGVPGPNLKPSSLDCGRDAAACRGFANRWMIRSAGMTMAQLAVRLQPLVARPVEDRTGLAGSFTLDLKWGDAGPPETERPATADEAAALITALRDQLGLTLVSTRGRFDVVVVDAISRPLSD